MGRAIEDGIWLAGVLLVLSAGCGEPSTELSQLSDRQLNLTFESDADPANDIITVEVTSDDPRSECLHLDPDTEFEVGGVTHELGDPTGQGEDECPEELVWYALAEDDLDRSSPTHVTVSDDSQTLKMSVRDLFVPRQLEAPSPLALAGCSTLRLNYRAKGDTLTADGVEAEFSLPGSDPNGLYALRASVSGSTIQLAVPTLYPGSKVGAGTLSVDVRAELATEDCVGATRCVAEADTHFETPATLSTGCE